MTDQPDLKARVEKRYSPVPVPPCVVCGKPLSIAAAGRGMITYACEAGDSEHYARSRFETHSSDSDVLALLSRITELEAERDEWKSRTAERDAEAERRARKQWDAEARAQAAESRLALADRLAEAGRAFQPWSASYEGLPDSYQPGVARVSLAELRALSAALAAYEEGGGASVAGSGGTASPKSDNHNHSEKEG